MGAINPTLPEAMFAMEAIDKEDYAALRGDGSRKLSADGLQKSIITNVVIDKFNMKFNALGYAAFCNDRKALEIMQNDCGADIMAMSICGSACPHETMRNAILDVTPDMLSYMIGKGFPVQGKDDECNLIGATLYRDWADKKRTMANIALLINAGLDLTRADPMSHETELRSIVSFDRADILELAFLLKPDVMTERMAQTLLNIAIIQSKPACAETLIRHGGMFMTDYADQVDLLKQKMDKGDHTSALILYMLNRVFNEKSAKVTSLPETHVSEKPIAVGKLPRSGPVNN